MSRPKPSAGTVPRFRKRNSSWLSLAARIPEPCGAVRKIRSRYHVICRRGAGRYCPRSGNRLTSVGDTVQRRTSLRVQEAAIVFSALGCGSSSWGNVGGRLAQWPVAADRQAPAQASTSCGLEPEPKPRARFMFWLVAQGTGGRWLLREVRGHTRLV